MINRVQTKDAQMQEMIIPSVSTPSKIMVVDDQPLSLLLAVDLIRYEGYEVIEVSDSRQALKVAFEQQPDVILADIVMPFVNGLELIRNLKVEPHTQSIPVLLMSVTPDSSLRHQALQVGAEDMIVKPLDHTQLYSKLKNLVRQKRLNEVLSQTQKILLTLATVLRVRSHLERQSYFTRGNLVEFGVRISDFGVKI